MISYHKQKKVRKWKTWSLRETEQIGQITSSCSLAAARCQICIKPSHWSPVQYPCLWLAANLTTLTSHQESINNAESPRNPEMWVKLDVRKTTTDLMIILQRNETDAWPSQALLCYKQLWTSVRSNSGKIRIANFLSIMNILFKTLPRGVHNIWRSTVLSLSPGPLLGRTLHRCIILL